MTATHKNFLKTTISAVASAGLGALTISTASSGYRTFGAGDDGLTFDGISIVEGTAWEVRDGCVYTHSGTSLSRGTLQDSSTGSAITFTSAAVVSQNPSAGLAGRIEQVALVRATGGDSSITLAPNTHYTWDLSTLTADRTGTLPTTAAVGDAIEISAITGNASYELIMSTGSGQTCALGGTVVAASTEITRLFIAGESMRFVYEASNKWTVQQDGRFPQSANLGLTNDADGEGAGTWVLPTSFGGAWTQGAAIGATTNTSNGDIVVRRAGTYNVTVMCRAKDPVADGQYYGVRIGKNNAEYRSRQCFASAAQTTSAILNDPGVVCAAGDTLQLYYVSQAGGVGARSSAGAVTFISVTEVL